jgi:phosphoribosylanthranilate isomerase
VTAVGIKVCGLTRESDAAQAEAAGAACLGVILAGGPRLVTEEQARRVLGPRRPGVQRVAVFGHQPREEILRLADSIDLDVLQLHGCSNPEMVHWIRVQTGRSVWAVVRVSGEALPEEVGELAASTDALVLDALVPGQLGGTGVALDWRGLRHAVGALRARQPGLRLVLAGGLKPQNVREGIALLAPWCVDVSSGVESAPGVKDPALITAFVTAAREPL